MLTLTDVNLIRSNTYFKSQSFKDYILKAVGSPFQFLTDTQTTEYFLKDINLTIGPGEKVALLGKNGSGKSTLCKILTNKFLPTSGQIASTFSPRHFNHLESSFFAELTGHENITFFCNRLFSDLCAIETEKLILEIEDFSELGQALYRPVETYSSGMRTRLSLSIILARQHDLLILDEVHSHADIAFRSKVERKLEQIVVASNSVVIVTHYIDEITNLCPRGIVIDNGKIVFDGNFTKAVACYNLLNKVNV